MRVRSIASSVCVLATVSLLSAACQPERPTEGNQPTVQPAVEAPADLVDALVLYSSNKRHVSEIGFQRVAEFYGLTVTELDMRSTRLTDEALRDPRGAYYSIVFVDGETLETRLDDNAIKVLKHATRQAPLHIMVGALEEPNAKALGKLTDGEITATFAPDDTAQEYQVGKAAPEITRELTGVSVAGEGDPQDRGLTIAPGAVHTRELVTATDNQGSSYPVYAQYQSGAGSIFVASGATEPTLKYNRLEWHYFARRSGELFEQRSFAQLVPLLMFVRFAGGNEVWHRDHDYANLMLDDPALTEKAFDYAGILQQSITHNFHVTVAMPPMYYNTFDQSVVDLFLNYPTRLSIVQHGNNHDGYEFYKYQVVAGDEYPARPLEEQEANLVEGRTRMEAFAQRTGLDYAPVMIFPYNIAPIETIGLLKQYGFQATINSKDVPIDTERLDEWDSYMYPAEMGYRTFPVLGRSSPKSRPHPFDLFLDRPVLIYEHRPFFKEQGIEAFNPTANAINNLQGEVEWQSLDRLMKRLYLEKQNDNGSIEVMFFGNHVVVANETGKEQTYHLWRKEDQYIPIRQVLVDGLTTPYTVERGRLAMEVTISGGSERDIAIMYGAKEKNFRTSANAITTETITSTTRISATITNTGSAAGPISLEVFNGAPDSGAQSFGILTTTAIQPQGTERVELTETLVEPEVCIVIDPYNVVEETDETDNVICTP